MDRCSRAGQVDCPRRAGRAGPASGPESATGSVDQAAHNNQRMCLSVEKFFKLKNTTLKKSVKMVKNK